MKPSYELLQNKAFLLGLLNWGLLLAGLFQIKTSCHIIWKKNVQNLAENWQKLDIKLKHQLLEFLH